MDLNFSEITKKMKCFFFIMLLLWKSAPTKGNTGLYKNMQKCGCDLRKIAIWVILFYFSFRLMLF